MSSNNKEPSPYPISSERVPRSRIPTLPSLTYADIKEARERELIKLVVAESKKNKHKEDTTYKSVVPRNRKPPIKREEE